MKQHLLSLLFAFTALFANAQDFSFKHFSMLDGLSHNQVNDICRDDEGFMWLSTAWGLNRYDGYTFRHILNSPGDSLSLQNNYVEMVRVLHNNRLLVRSASGFQIYDCNTERFLPSSEFTNAIGTNAEITVYYVDKQRRVWAALGSSVFCYSSDTEQTVFCDLSSVVPRICGNIVAISQESHGMVFAYADGSIALLGNDMDLANVQLMRTPVRPGSHFLFVDNSDGYWVWTNGKTGVWYCSASDRKWVHCTSDPSSFYRVPGEVIKCMTQDGLGRLWIATDHGGVAVLNLQTHSSRILCSESNNPQSIVDNSIYSLCCDSEGSVWVGYYKSGFSIYNETIFKFSTDRTLLSGLGDDFVGDITVIEEDINGSLWLGTNSCGLLHVDRRTGRKTLYKNIPNDVNSLSSNTIVSLLSASDGTLWVGTFQGGLCKFDGKKFTRFKSKSSCPKAMAGENIWDLSEDAHQNVWVGSLGHGLASYNIKTGESHQYDVSNGMLTSDYVSSLSVSRDGKVFAGTAVGVTMLDPVANSTRPITIAGTDEAWTENVNDILYDTRGLLWAAARTGLYVVDLKTNNSWVLSTDNGLINNVVIGVVEDNNKNIWVTTANGVSNIVVGRNPRTDEYFFTILNYAEQDGLQATAFNVRSIKRTSYGEILLGSFYGINSFATENIHYNQNKPKVHFVSLDIFDKEVRIGEEVDGRVVLENSLSNTESITLDYSQNMFSVNFSTLSYILPEKIQYTYCLEGFTDKWITSNEPKISYTNLTPGDYQLHVRASNSDGFWSDEMSTLNITILPPWWMSTPAYLCYLLVIIGIIMLVRQQVKLQERNRYRLQEIKAEMQRKHEIDDMKLKFFTNVSHELRTPLSLIISPLENLIAETGNQQLRDKLTLIHRNATRLLQLVNQLLDFRKTDVGGTTLNLSEGDIVSFVRQSSEAFHSLADRDMHFIVTSAVDQINMKFDRDKVGKIVSNLLSNAFKFTPEGGRIELWIGRSSDGKNVLIRVSDTGVGIPDKYKESVFERFFQVPRREAVYGGSGIGLHLVKEFVMLHGGTVSVGDNVGQGTVMTVALPITSSDELPDSPEAETAETEDVEGEEKQEASRKTLLIVDDNADFRQLLNDTLCDEYDIRQARNGQEAIDAVLKDMPDMIISDVMMPVLDGNQLCNKVKSDVRTSHIPFIMLTAKTADEHKIEGLGFGADEYMTKPFNPQILKLRVAKLLELGRQRQEKFHNQIDPEPSEITITPLDEQLIQKAIKCCEDNMSNTDFSVEELSRNLGMSRVHLYKKLTAITGHSPIEFIRIIRLKRAAQLLRDKQQNVAEVAYAVGFNNPKYFSKYFKEEFGVLPSVYQNQNAQDIRRTDIAPTDDSQA